MNGMVTPAVLDELNYTSRFDFTDFIPTDTFHFAAKFAVWNASVARFYQLRPSRIQP
jgi:hypothetical protein